MYLLLMIIACFPEIRKGEEERFIDNPSVDNDGDNFSEEDGDCNDRDDDIHPNADEICDGVDNDCNEIIDDNPTDIEVYYLDADGDGFGIESDSILSCPDDKPVGYIGSKERNGVVVFDCDDAPPEDGELNGAAFHPDAEEICDELDNDCDGEIDEEIDTAPTWYLDSDSDTFGDINQTLKACPVNGDEPPAGYVENSADCDDENGLAFPNAEEQCNDIDDNCNGVVDEAAAADAPLWYADVDSDGFGSVLNVVPSCQQPNIELSDGTIVNYVSDNTDCNDSDALISPNGIESCDSMDNDCDGFIDEGSGSDAPQDAIVFYADLDGDGYGADSQSIVQCVAPTGFVDNVGDCDDFSSVINPNASETCNGLDDNCDGVVDESGAIGETIFYLDGDGDGFGLVNQFQSACTVPIGYSSALGDCDDTDALVFPTAIEVCDEIDNNCDALIDDADPTVVLSPSDVWYLDSDGDGWGSSTSPVQSCVAPQGYVYNNKDCNDRQDLQFPGAPEQCNNQDDNCDGTIDDNPPSRNLFEWYTDADIDGHGALVDVSSMSVSHPDGYDLLACPAFDPNTGLPGPPSGYSATNDDCNDTDPLISPSADELCSSNVDENCDGLPLAGATNFNTYVVDFDMDGYPNSTATPNGELIYAFESCLQPLGYIPYNLGDALDCNDSDMDVHPNGDTEHTHQLVGGGSVTHTHAEQINGKVDLCENDWNGDLTPPHDEWDDDGDGYVEGILDVQFLYNSDGTVNGWESTQTIYGGQDCDDADVFTYPLAEEICNGAFEDCFASDYVPGGSPWLETDDDGDGYVECSGYDALTWEADPVTGGDDCNDSIADLFPRIHPDTLLPTCFADYDGDGYPDRDWGFCDTAFTSGDSEGSLLGIDGKLGWKVAYAGDVDGDGLDDVLASAIYNSEGVFFGGAVYLFLGSTLSSNISLDASNADYTFYGTSGQGYLGSQLSTAGDVDGDGLDDILFSSTSSADYAGVVYLFLASSLTTPGEVEISTADVIFEGEIGGGSLTGDRLGGALSTAGDVDGDGLDDILLGAAYADVDVVSNAGKVYLILGSSLDGSGTFDVSTSDVIFTGEVTSEGSGTHVSTAGDVDGDGLDDILISAPAYANLTGRTFLVLASSLDFTGSIELVNSEYIFVGDSGFWSSGETALSVGDINGGGVPDIAISAPNYDIAGQGVSGQDKGRVFLFWGETLPAPGTIFLSTADVQFAGESKGEQFGRSLSSTVDLDGDGLSDLIIGAHNIEIDGDNNSGRINIFFGADIPSSGEVLRSQAGVEIVGSNGEHFAHAVASNGDINGDGLSDVLVGAPYNIDNGNGTGKVSIVLACEQ